jgi:predicted O-methyltransferase YrrM
MAEQPWGAVDKYLCDLLLEPDPSLDAALEASREGGLPAINVAPNQGKLLNLLVRSLGASSVLEIGTLGGYSTIWMARALPDGGRLITLEAAPKHAAVAQRNLERAGVAERVEVRVGAALDGLRQLADEGAGPFDFIFIDADKPGYPEYLTASLKLSRPGTVIVGDNVVRGGLVADPGCPDAAVRGAQQFMASAAANPRLASVVLQTVGIKGYDGLLIARVVS